MYSLFEMNRNTNHRLATRRSFLRSAVVAPLAAAVSAEDKKRPPLAGEVGVTTGSFMRNLSESAQPGKLRLLDLPKIMRDELDMRVIDLMTATLASMEPGYLEELRTA